MWEMFVCKDMPVQNFTDTPDKLSTIPSIHTGEAHPAPLMGLWLIGLTMNTQNPYKTIAIAVHTTMLMY